MVDILKGNEGTGDLKVSLIIGVKRGSAVEFGYYSSSLVAVATGYGDGLGIYGEHLNSGDLLVVPLKGSGCIDSTVGVNVKDLLLGGAVIVVRAVTDVMSFKAALDVEYTLDAGLPFTKIGCTLSEGGYGKGRAGVCIRGLRGSHVEDIGIVAGRAGLYYAVIKDEGTAVPVGVGLYDYGGRGILVAKVVAYVIGLVRAVCICGVAPLVCIVVAGLDSKEIIGHAVANCAVLSVIDVTHVDACIGGCLDVECSLL